MKVNLSFREGGAHKFMDVTDVEIDGMFVIIHQQSEDGVERTRVFNGHLVAWWDEEPDAMDMALAGPIAPPQRE